MHVVSSNEMDAFEADQARAFPQRFHQWWQQAINPKIEKQMCDELVMRHQEEFEPLGLREEEAQFLFLYARALMPGMGDPDYLETMDVIFGGSDDRHRLQGLNDIARKYGHRG